MGVGGWRVGAVGARPGPFGTARVAVEVPPDRRTIDLPPIRVARRRIAEGEARGDLGFTLVGGEPGVDAQLAPLRVATVRYGGPAAASFALDFYRIFYRIERDEQ